MSQKYTYYHCSPPIIWMEIRIADVELYNKFHIWLFYFGSGGPTPGIVMTFGAGSVSAGFTPEQAERVIQWLKEHGVKPESEVGFIK